MFHTNWNITRQTTTDILLSNFLAIQSIFTVTFVAHFWVRSEKEKVPHFSNTAQGLKICYFCACDSQFSTDFFYYSKSLVHTHSLRMNRQLQTQQQTGHLADGGGKVRVIKDAIVQKKSVPIIMDFDEEKKRKEIKETKLTMLKTFLVIMDIYLSQKCPHLYPSSTAKKSSSSTEPSAGHIGSTLRASSSSGSISMMNYNGSDFDTLFNDLDSGQQQQQADVHKRKQTDSPKIIPNKKKSISTVSK